MKKIILTLSVLFIGFLGACSEKEETAVNEPVKEVAVEETKEEVKEETVTEVIKEEPKKEENVAGVAALKYENTQEGVLNGVEQIVENINTALVYGTNQFGMDAIKSWFSDFEGSDDQLDIYLSILNEKGLEEKDLVDRKKEFSFTQGANNEWAVDLKLTGSGKSETVVTNWDITAKPGPTGDLVIDINEIK